MAPRLIAVGAICDTRIYRVDQVPALPGKILASAMCQVTDGMAISAACAFVRLGGRAAVWARLGDDAAGGKMRRDLVAEGVDVSGLHVVSASASSQVAVIVDQRGDRLVVPFHDPGVDASPDWLPLERLAEADFLHCDARWADGAEAALNAARERGVPSMLDGEVAPLETLQRLVPLADYAVFSDAGLLIYAGCDDVLSALCRVGAAHPGHVGASCGADGYYWYEHGEIRHVAAPVVEVVDTLAAGDVFHGAFALALLEGLDIAGAARFACTAASLKCTRFGSRLGCPTREEVDAFIRTRVDAVRPEVKTDARQRH